MSDSIGDDIGVDGIVIPDLPQTKLAFRTWRISDEGKLLSINAPDLTGKAGGSATKMQRVSWIHRQLADEEGQGGWEPGQPLVAHCGRGGKVDDPDHGPIPAKRCSCGIYATTSIKVINQYLGTEIIHGTIAIRGPVLGVVEMGGHTIPATQGFRAAVVRIAAIIKLDQAFTLPHSQLKLIAAKYDVPLVDDISLDPEDYRGLLVPEMSLADETEEFLKGLFNEEGGEE